MSSGRTARNVIRPGRGSRRAYPSTAGTFLRDRSFVVLRGSAGRGPGAGRGGRVGGAERAERLSGHHVTHVVGGLDTVAGVTWCDVPAAADLGPYATVLAVGPEGGTDLCQRTGRD
ncbi:hypothetical protein [Streptomyces sp. NPDC006333]|uniref:hypothetical protein n=1 Tax=unclassified Streptomyces TaxID=2593676 RepID=UPI0033AD39EE